MEQLNKILLHLESEMAQTQAEGHCQAQEYKALLNIKAKLQADIASYLPPLAGRRGRLQPW